VGGWLIVGAILVGGWGWGRRDTDRRVVLFGTYFSS